LIWSYRLLSPAEQYCFTRLSDLSGSWSLEDAFKLIQSSANEEEIFSPTDMISMLNVVAKLVDNSLLIRQPSANGQIQFRMLNTIREYALERLAAQKVREPLHATIP
jgi:predicted ATPase